MLENADVVVYDRLIGGSILALIPEMSEQIAVGKMAGHHLVPQNQINEILVNQAKEGKRVVRLKGGDPLVFGRGGEELDYLLAHEIPFEVVPGVTSAVAVPAYQGIPITHRDCSSSLHIITGHKKAGEHYDIDFEALVRTKGTLIFLMGAKTLKDILSGLLKAGIKPDMPAALLQKGTSSKQSKIMGTVATLPEMIKMQQIQSPALVIVGDVCRYSERFSWTEDLPLGRAKILLTRPETSGKELTDRLLLEGAEVLHIPAVHRKELDSESLIQRLEKPDIYHWIAFSSPFCVTCFFNQLKGSIDIRSLKNSKIAALGAGTKAALEEKGLLADLMPEEYSGASLGQSLAKECGKNDRILLLQALDGTEDTKNEIRKRKDIILDEIALYKTEYSSAKAELLKRELESGEIDYILFTSSSCVRGFIKMAGECYNNIPAVCIGQNTAAAARAAGFEAFTAAKATADGLVDMVIKLEEIKKRQKQKRG